MKHIKFTFIFVISFFVISCGFHLRGSQDFSKILPEVNVAGVNKHSYLGRELLRSLASANVNVFDESQFILTITQDKFTKRVLSVDSAGRANQYELKYDVSFSLTKNESNEKEKKIIDLIPTQSISIKREYLFDANLILAAQDEENRLKQDMRQSIIIQLMRRLQFLLKAKNKVNK